MTREGHRCDREAPTTKTSDFSLHWFGRWRHKEAYFFCSAPDLTCSQASERPPPLKKKLLLVVFFSK